MGGGVALSGFQTAPRPPGGGSGSRSQPRNPDEEPLNTETHIKTLKVFWRIDGVSMSVGGEGTACRGGVRRIERSPEI